MKKKLSSTEIRDQYVKSLLIIEKSNIEGDYKIGNKEGEKIIRLFKLLEVNVRLAKQVLPFLFKHDSIKVKICAAAHCLALKIYVAEAINILDNISKLNVRIFSFEAEMTLKVWYEQGYLKIYPEQE